MQVGGANTQSKTGAWKRVTVSEKRNEHKQKVGFSSFKVRKYEKEKGKEPI